MAHPGGLVVKRNCIGLSRPVRHQLCERRQGDAEDGFGHAQFGEGREGEDA